MRVELLNIIRFPFLLICAYLIGSIPWGLILTRRFKSIDIRSQGSGNIGATNVTRTAGIALGLLTLLGDTLKGIISVWLAMNLTGPNDSWREIYVSLVILSVFGGHLYPLYLKFKDGGKGVATAAGCFLVISPLVFVPVLLVFAGVVWWRKHVSLGSLAAAGVLPFIVWLITASMVMAGCALVITFFICYRHKENIRRLIAGTEPVFRV